MMQCGRSGGVEEGKSEEEETGGIDIKIQLQSEGVEEVG